MFSPHLSEPLSDYFVPQPPEPSPVNGNYIIKERSDNGCYNKSDFLKNIFVFPFNNVCACLLNDE